MDLVLVVMAVEFAFLGVRARRSRVRGGEPRLDLVFTFAPGVCLLLALRAALVGAGWPQIALALAASFPFHIADLICRRL